MTGITKYAALCNDQASIRVYGLGDSPEAAENEARATYTELGWDWSDCEIVDVTAEQAKQIEAGVVEARDLSIAVGPGTLHRLTVREFGKVRIFRGDATRQVDGDGHPVDPEKWYFEPTDYDGDVVWSEAYGSYADAYHACGASQQ